jgi:hypothetical protein
MHADIAQDGPETALASRRFQQMLLFWRSALLCVFMLHSSHTSMHADHLRPNRPGTQHYLNNESINAIHLPWSKWSALADHRTCSPEQKKTLICTQPETGQIQEKHPQNHFSRHNQLHTVHKSYLVHLLSLSACALPRALSLNECHPPHST